VRAVISHSSNGVSAKPALNALSRLRTPSTVTPTGSQAALVRLSCVSGLVDKTAK